MMVKLRSSAIAERADRVHPERRPRDFAEVADASDPMAAFLCHEMRDGGDDCAAEHHAGLM